MYKEKIIKSTIWNFLGTLLMLVIGIGSSIVYVRYLGDHDYGVAIYVTDLSIFVVTVCSLGLGTYQAKVLPKLRMAGEFSQYRAILLSNIRIRLLCIALATCFIFGLKFFGGARLLSQGSYGGQFLVLFILLQMSLAVLRGPLQIEYQQKFLNLLDVSALLIKFAMVLLVIWFDWGLIGFLLSEVAVEGIQLALLLRCFHRLIWPHIRECRAALAEKVLAKSLPMYLVDMSSRIYGKEYDVFFLGFLLGQDSFRHITVYSLSYVLVTRVFSFLGLGTASAATLLMNFSAELVQDEKAHLLTRLAEKQFKMLAFLVLPIMFGGMLLGGKVLQLLYGTEFKEFGVINAMFFFGYGVSSISYVSKPILLVIGRDRQLLKLRVLLSLVKTVLLFVAVSAAGIYGAAGVTTAIIAVSSLLEGVILQKELGFKVPVRLITRLLLANLVMSAAVTAFIYFVSGAATLVNIVVCVLLGMSVYFLVLMLAKPLDGDDCAHLQEIGLLNRLKVTRILAYFSSSPRDAHGSA